LKKQEKGRGKGEGAANAAGMEGHGAQGVAPELLLQGGHYLEPKFRERGKEKRIWSEKKNAQNRDPHERGRRPGWLRKARVNERKSRVCEIRMRSRKVEGDVRDPEEYMVDSGGSVLIREIDKKGDQRLLG